MNELHYNSNYIFIMFKINFIYHINEDIISHWLRKIVN